jgi:DNA replication protein DnaC
MNSSDVTNALRNLRLPGMADSFELQVGNRAFDDLSCTEIIGNMCAAQQQHNADRTQAALKAKAKFKLSAQTEDIDWCSSRGIDKPKLRGLFDAEWVRRTENVLLSGASGTGKTYIGCALGNAAVRTGLSVRYCRTNLLLEELRRAHVDGSIAKQRRALSSPKLLILDDFGIAPIPEISKEDLFELLDMRCDSGSTMIIGQLAPADWHGFLGTNHMADAMMDRIVQRAHTIALKGDSRRKRL